MHHQSEAGGPITPNDYRAIFAGRQSASVPFSGVCGRVIRVGVGEKPEYLSYPHTKRLAWVVGPDGLADMVGKTGLQVLLALGTKPDRIAENMSKGMRWGLAVFPETSCTLATWDGLFHAVERHYPPGLADRLRRHAGALWNGPSLLGTDQLRTFAEPAVREHPEHPDHMTPERYLAAADTPANAWLFLWHSVGVNNQFAGTGYSRDAEGRSGQKEYLAPNVRLADLGGDVAIIEFDVAGDALRMGSLTSNTTSGASARSSESG